ncbi:MAG TPA: FecR domain-containing protein, partial [Anseongella sp.]|nr:FecR domain-containing protein [Anseongella sp.]
GSREVFLEGEAFFEIARDSSRPFIIHSSGIQTRVLGTSFNVQAYKGQKAMRVVVLTGKVEVSAPRDAKGGEKEKVVLQASQMATYTHSEKQLNRTEVPDVEQYTAWKTGRLIFNQTPMSEVALRLEQEFGLKIKMENSAIERCKITGRFDKSQSAGLTLEAICKSIEARYRIENGTVFIQGQGCEK